MSTLISTNPATLETIEHVPDVSPDIVQSHVATARAAAHDWAALSFRQRGQYMLKARDYLLQHIDALALTITQENGKPIVEAFSADLYPIADLLYYFAHNTESLLRPHRPSTGLMAWLGRRSRVDYRPCGVVGIISPWNFPFSIPAGAVAMALMAGNTVILKPSEITPRVGARVAEMFAAADLPSGVLTTLQGDGAVGAALVSSRVDKIFFTGSVATGKKIMASCAEMLTPCALELGGKDPMIVLPDADLDLASSGAVWGAFTNAGQCCASVERVYVHRDVAETFTQQVVEKTKKLRQGIGTNPDVDIGPLTTQTQLDIVEAHVNDARTKGATILTGGDRNAAHAGRFYQPTVLTNVSHDMIIMTEETFGPVLPIMVISDTAEAIRLANDSRYGLSASVWTHDTITARTIAKQLQVGTVTINECLYTHAICQTPWGGCKESGFGRTHGQWGMLEMVDVHHVHSTLVAHKDLWWYPYSQRLYETFRMMARSVTGSWWQRLVALPRLLKSLRLNKW